MEPIRATEIAEAIERAAERVAKPIVETLELIHRKQIRKILDVPTRAAGGSTELKDCEAVDLRYVRYLAVTCQGRLHPDATASLTVHVRTSVDGGKWDDDDFTSFDLPLKAGMTIQKTQAVSPDPSMLKVIVENKDAAHPASDIRVWVVY